MAQEATDSERDAAFQEMDENVDAIQDVLLMEIDRLLPMYGAAPIAAWCLAFGLHLHKSIFPSPHWDKIEQVILHILDTTEEVQIDKGQIHGMKMVLPERH